ncbi:ABC transporter ATP-binding protein [Methylomonas rhizoryzae]|uniref:ABC transporter ATP-binding protein n=1 Tax=Methylomonas rhizoryzae TaxID=2608981 RepID=UPI00123230E3|nr:ATP-binding cassette domain-containing protein [Methylomonas rhizoryzae]
MTYPHISVSNLTMAYGDYIVQRDLNFTIARGEIFIVMGGSGCGKSTLLMHMIGLKTPRQGDVFYEQQSLWQANAEQRNRIMRRIGVLYQGGALFSSMTLAENVALPLNEFTELSKSEIADMVSYKLALVGLAGFETYYPAELSGGMQKRAGLARAMALDPEILFFDEPSSGLDPISARLLDDLIVSLRDALGTTVVVISHELPSIFAIGTNSVLLDADAKTMLAQGPPKQILEHAQDPRIIRFLTRGTGIAQSAPAKTDT